MDCPGCSKPLDKLYALAPATMTISRTVGAEIEPDDFSADNVRHDWRGDRLLNKFRLDEELTELATLDHSGLELDDERSLFYCTECQHEIPRAQVNEWLDEVAAKDPALREPF